MTEKADYPDFLPDESRTDVALSLGTILASAVPGLGGAVSAVLSEWSAERRYARVREVLEDLALRLQDLRSDVTEQYVLSDEFADLLDQTLRRVAQERHEEKRRLYARFLAGAIAAPGESYDEQLRIPRVLDQLQLGHIKIVRAILQAPEPPGGYRYVPVSGSFEDTLARRLPDISKERIGDLVGQLDDLRIAKLSLGTMMTAQGAEDMRGTLTDFGRRVVRFIQEEPGS